MCCTKMVKKAVTDEEDDSFERIEELNNLDDSYAEEQDITHIADKLSEAKSEIEKLRRDIHSCNMYRFRINMVCSFAIALLIILFARGSQSSSPICPPIAIPKPTGCPKCEKCMKETFSRMVNNVDVERLSLEANFITKEPDERFSILGCEVLQVNEIDIHDKNDTEIHNMMRTPYNEWTTRAAELILRRNPAGYEKLLASKRRSFIQGAVSAAMVTIGCICLYSLLFSTKQPLSAVKADDKIAWTSMNSDADTEQDGKETEPTTVNSPVELTERDEQRTVNKDGEKDPEVTKSTKVLSDEEKREFEMCAARAYVLKREFESLEKRLDELCPSISNDSNLYF